MADKSQELPVIAITAAVGAIVLLGVLCFGIWKKDDELEKTEEHEQKNGSTKNNQSQQKKLKPITRQKKEPKMMFTHPWLASSLKGHSSNITGFDFSPNGKYLASCAEDRTILLWGVKDFSQKEHKYIRANVDLDHAMQVKFSPDSRAFITSLSMANSVRIFKFGKKDDGSLSIQASPEDFQQKHTADVINIGIASSGRFIMTCSKDTTIIVWDLKGEVLSTIDTHQVNNSYGAVSLCGRFVASSGFTPDVKVWEVCFDKSGAFREVTRAFELKGHSAGIYSFAFNGDSTRMVSVSKDGTWKFWNTNIEYAKGQDPYLLQTGKCKHTGRAIIAISHDSRTVTISTAFNISVYSTVTMECEQSIDNPHTEPVRGLDFSLNDKYIISCGDKQVHVFHNIVGYRATIVDAQEKKKKAKGGPQKDRLQKEINEARESLQRILGEAA